MPRKKKMQKKKTLKKKSHLIGNSQVTDAQK